MHEIVEAAASVTVLWIAVSLPVAIMLGQMIRVRDNR
jgi:hypothetical protein